MKKGFYALVVSLTVLGLVACSDDPSIDNHPKEQLTQPNGDNTVNLPDDTRVDNSGNKSDDGHVEDLDAKAKMEELPFTDFELEIDYGMDDEFDFEYKNFDDNGKYRAELKDSINDKKLKGAEAFETLYIQLKDAELDQIQSKKEAIEKMLRQFQLQDNYKEFDLEYTLRDGTKKKFEDKQ